LGLTTAPLAEPRSRAEFVAKLGIVLEEADETAFWLEVMRDAGIFPEQSCVGSFRKPKNSSLSLSRPSERQRVLLLQFDF
jgi:hypothetical protein